MSRYIPSVLFSLLLVIFCGVVFHAPFSVWAGTIWPSAELAIKAWKEMLLLIAVLLLIFDITCQKKWRMVADDWLVRLAGVYAVIYMALIPLMWQGTAQTVAGLMIDLRFVVFFVAVYVSVRLYPAWRKPFLIVGGIVAVLSMVFAVLQVTVLPHDVLKYLGYSKNTIEPYLTVDQNNNYVRINGTLRGPNPLGVYAGIVITLGVAWLSVRWQQLRNSKLLWAVLGTIIAALVALWFSYSRSALVMTLVAGGVLLLLRFGPHISKGVWFALGSSVLLLLGGLYIAKDTSFVSHVILHEDPTEGNDVNSNDGHWESLVSGTGRMLQQPFGAGVGSTGSPSLLGDDGIIIENYYLYVAHEAGWLGLAAFIALFAMVLQQLYQKRTDWLSLGVFAAGVGIAVACLVLPVYADDTVAMVWWGLAAIALGSTGHKNRRAALQM